MKRLILIACLLASPTLAQTPFGFSGLTTGVAPGPNVPPFSASGLNAAGATKADKINGILTTPTITGPTITSPAVIGGAFSSPAVTGTLSSVNLNLIGNAQTGSWIYSYPGAAFVPSLGTLAAVSPFGGSALAGYSQGSDNTQPGTSQAGFAVAGFANNNNSSTTQSMYAGYFEARKAAIGGGTAEGIEATASNQGAVTTRSPFTINSAGDTMGIQIGAGRADLSGAANSTALLVLSGSTAVQAQTGIIVKSSSINPNNGRGFANPILLDMPSQYSLVWEDRSAGLPSAWVYANVSTNGTGGGGVFIGDSGVQLQGPSGTNLLTVNSTEVQTPQPVTINNTLTVQNAISTGSTVIAAASHYNPVSLSALPTGCTAGDAMFVSDGRNTGESTGAGTGVLAYCNSAHAWFANGAPVTN